jgi:hypothetical protein
LILVGYGSKHLQAAAKQQATEGRNPFQIDHAQSILNYK